MSEEKYLYDLMSPVDYMNVCNAVLATRKEEDDGAVTYEEIEYTADGTLYKVQGHHFPVQDVIDSADNKCKVCTSKGYTVVNIPKEKLPDPSGYFVIESDDKAKDDPKMWRILTPCECGVKNVIKKNAGVFTIDTRCVFVDLTFTSEQVGEKKEEKKPKFEIYN